MPIQTRRKDVMRLPVGMLAAASSLAVLCAAVAAAQAAKGAVRVEVSDSSGGRMPGVTVVATPVDGEVLTAVTDRMGGYVFPAVSAGPVMLRFRLEGFAGALAGVTVESGAETRVVQRLELAPLMETVDVLATAPVEKAPPLPPPPPPPVPSPSRGPLIRPVPPHDRDSVCGPAKPSAATESLGTIRSSRYVAEGGRYTTGGQITVDGGALNGLEVGQNLVVRRYFRVPRLAGTGSTGVHSAGLVQIVAVSERSSIAVAIYACDELRTGDFLASFRPEPIRPPEPRGLPDYGDAARILFADEGQTLGTPGRQMVIDRGSERGIRVGQRLTLFRRRDARGPTSVGDAIVVATRIDSATIRVDRVNDVISSGDLAAPQIPETKPWGDGSCGVE
jgi:Carboxypeptidase regulatory-like domain